MHSFSARIRHTVAHRDTNSQLGDTSWTSKSTVSVPSFTTHLDGLVLLLDGQVSMSLSWTRMPLSLFFLLLLCGFERVSGGVWGLSELAAILPFLLHHQKPSHCAPHFFLQVSHATQPSHPSNHTLSSPNFASSTVHSSSSQLLHF